MNYQEVNGYLWILAQVLNKAFGMSADNLHEGRIDEFFNEEYHIQAMAIADDKYGMRGFIRAIFKHLPLLNGRRWKFFQTLCQLIFYQVTKRGVHGKQNIAVMPCIC